LTGVIPLGRWAGGKLPEGQRTGLPL